MSDWISVEERLPEGLNKWGSRWWLVKPMRGNPTSALFDEDNGNWYSRAAAGETHKVFKVFVTHWMPLP